VVAMLMTKIKEPGPALGMAEVASLVLQALVKNGGGAVHKVCEGSGHEYHSSLYLSRLQPHARDAMEVIPSCDGRSHLTFLKSWSALSMNLLFGR
jgi:hypothetical protein